MTKKYTAQEMRETADGLKDDPGMDALIIADMLRQAADDMEREKKYEYTLRNSEGIPVWCIENKIDRLKFVKEEDETIVRREVGKWEEVGDE